MDETKAADEQFMQKVLRDELMTREDLDQCLSTQTELQQQGKTLPLRDIAVEKGLLQPDQVPTEPAPQEPSVTQRIGDFELVEKIGQGGMGSVYKARQISMDRPVALKLLPENLARDPQFVSRFYREARASARLDHPNVIRGIAVGEVEGSHYFAMEYVQGKSLSQILKEQPQLPMDKVLDIMLQVTRALGHAHARDIIHRDLKPGNILITDDGVAKLADLGLAKRLDSAVSALTQSGSGMGTPYYMPPEQARDAKRADKASDVYALGATFYHIATGQVPFSGDTPAHVLMAHLKETAAPAHKVRQEIPERLSLVIGKMMAKDPLNRFPDAGAVLEALEKVTLPKAKPAKAPPAETPKPKAAPEVWYFKKRDAQGRLKLYKTNLETLREHISTGKLSLDVQAGPGKAGPFAPIRTYAQFGGKAAVRRAPSTAGGRIDVGSFNNVYGEIAKKEKRDKNVRITKRVLKITLTVGLLLAAVILLLVYGSRLWGLIRGLF